MGSRGRLCIILCRAGPSVRFDIYEQRHLSRKKKAARLVSFRAGGQKLPRSSGRREANILTAGVDDLEVGPALGPAGIAEGRAVGGDRAVPPAVAQVDHLLRRVARQAGCGNIELDG